jgi:TFIIF-interacting CTD phosphatase-like protein
MSVFALPENPKGCGRTLILDLDETLACSQQNPQLEDYRIYRDPTIYRTFHPANARQICYSVVVETENGPLKVWGVTRPGLEEFLRFAQEYFENVIIWSAGIPPYVEEICKEIFTGPGLKMPRAIWSRDNCASEPAYFNTPQFYHKPLAKLVAALTSKDSPIKIDLAKTLILDDRTYTFLKNPENGVLIPSFRPSGTLAELTDRSDRSLYKFMEWLNRPEVRSASDYRVLDKSNIFT